MKQLILATLLIFANSIATAQENELSSAATKPVRVHLNVGAAVPFGGFGSTENNRYSSCASIGGLVSVGISGELHRNFAVGISLTSRTNPFDNEAYGQAADEGTGAKSTFDFEPYTSVHFSLDLYGQIPFHKSTAYIKASAGYGNLTFGGGTHTYLNEFGTSGTMKYYKHTSASPIFGLGTGYRYDFGRLGIGTDLAFMLTKKEVGFGTEAYKKPYSSLNITAALSYRIFNISGIKL